MHPPARRRFGQRRGGAIVVAGVAGLCHQLSSARRAREVAERRLDYLGEARGEVVVHDSRGGPVVVKLRPPEAVSPATAHWRHQALHDELTDLANRGGLLESLELLAAPHQARWCAVLYADLDGFKRINDTYGHAGGDQVLMAIADRLRDLVRPGDTVARLGGDEFVIVADGVNDAGAALEIAERVRRSVAAPLVIGTEEVVVVTSSFGIAIGAEREASTLLGRADVALYRAKRDGRNQCLVWTPALGAPTGRGFARRPQRL